MKLRLFAGIPDPLCKNFMLGCGSSLARGEHVTSTSWAGIMTRCATEAALPALRLHRFLNLRLEVEFSCFEWWI